MTHVTSRRQQDDGSALHAVDADGERWIVRTVPWFSTTGVEIGVQWFLTERDMMVEGEYRPSPTLSGPSAT